MASVTVNGCQDVPILESYGTENDKLMNCGTKTQNNIEGDNSVLAKDESGHVTKSVDVQRTFDLSNHQDIKHKNSENGKEKQKLEVQNLNGTSSQDGDLDKSVEEDGDDKYAGFGIRPHNADEEDEVMDSPPRMVFSLAGFAPLTEKEETNNKGEEKDADEVTQKCSQEIEKTDTEKPDGKDDIMDDEVKVSTENTDKDAEEEMTPENENIEDEQEKEEVISEKNIKNVDVKDGQGKVEESKTNVTNENEVCDKNIEGSENNISDSNETEKVQESEMEVEKVDNNKGDTVETDKVEMDKDQSNSNSDQVKDLDDSPNDASQLDNEGCSDKEEIQDEDVNSVVILDDEEKNSEKAENSDKSSVVEIENGEKTSGSDMQGKDGDNKDKKVNNSSEDSNSVISLDEENSSAKSSSEKDDKNQEKSEKGQGKSVEKMDIDGSEIVITINEDEDDSGDDSGKDADDESDEDDDDKERKKKIQSKTSPVKSSRDAVDGNANNNADKDVVVVDSPTGEKANSEKNSSTSGANKSATKEIKMPAGTVLTYPPGYSGQQNAQYIKVMGQNQQTFYMPVSSRYVVTTGSNQAPIAAKSGGPITVAVSQGKNQRPSTQQVVVVPSTGKPTETAKSNKVDDDIASSSWEQLELIKYEIATRKPDNTFWMGLANVNKKAELSSVTKFLFDLGSDIVKESAYRQIVSVQNKKLEAGKLNQSEQESLQKMKSVVKDLKEKVGCFDLKQMRCKGCGFQTPSKNVMRLHHEYPHMSPPNDVHGIMHCYKCSFSTKLPTAYTYHMNAEHNMTGRIYEKPAVHQCNLCQFENNSKQKLTQHKVKCMKNYKPHLNQAPYHFDISYCLKNIFYKFQIKKPAEPKPDLRTKALPSKPPMIQPKATARMPVYAGPPVRPQIANRFLLGPNQNVYRLNYTGQSQYAQQFQQFALNHQRPQLPGNKQLPRPQQTVSYTSSKPTVGQLLNQQRASSVQSTVAPNTRPQMPSAPQVSAKPAASNQGSSGFEVCEMCGGYVKDKMSLRIHFFYAHKIDMPPTIFNRTNPPLRCDVCKKMFWTTQGLTKHKQTMKHNINPKPSKPSQAMCWVCHQKPDNLYSHLVKFHKLTTSECMAMRRCMFCGTLSSSRKELEIHMAAAHGVLIKGEMPAGNKPASNPANPASNPAKPPVGVQVSTRTVVTGSSGSKSSPGLVRNNFCVFCAKQFSDNTQLTLHCLRDHATCSTCGMVVNKASDLQTHICKVNRNRSCEICGIKNLKSVYYTKHVTSHLKKCSVKLKRLSEEEITKATKRRKTNGPVSVDDIEIISDSESEEDKKGEKLKSAEETKNESGTAISKKEEVTEIPGEEGTKGHASPTKVESESSDSVKLEKDVKSEKAEGEKSENVQEKKESDVEIETVEEIKKENESGDVEKDLKLEKVEGEKSDNVQVMKETDVESETAEKIEKEKEESDTKGAESSEEKTDNTGLSRKLDDEKSNEKSTGLKRKSNEDSDCDENEDNPPRKRSRSPDKSDE